MDKISEFLNKYKKLIKSDKDLKEVISLTIKEKIGTEVGPDQISIRNRAVYIKGEAGLKNEIFLKKSLLLKEINEKASLTLDDIRF